MQNKNPLVGRGEGEMEGGGGGGRFNIFKVPTPLQQ